MAAPLFTYDNLGILKICLSNAFQYEDVHNCYYKNANDPYLTWKLGVQTDRSNSRLAIIFEITSKVEKGLTTFCKTWIEPNPYEVIREEGE